MGLVNRRIRRALRQIDQLEHRSKTLPEKTLEATTRVSNWNCAQQIHHTLQVLGLIAKEIRVLARDEEDRILRTGKPKVMIHFLLWFNYIPRGKAKAPDFLSPAPKFDRSELLRLAHDVREGLVGLEKLQDRISKTTGRSPHPMLGPLTARQWLGFVVVHTHHHIKIVKDIIEVVGKP